MEKLKANLLKSTPILFFTLLATVSLLWFKQGTMVYFHDEIIPLNPSTAVFDYLYIWRDNVNYGTLSAGGIPKLLSFGIFYIGDMLGMSIQHIEKVFYFITIFASGLGTYLLTIYVSKFSHAQTARIAGIMAGAMYIVSPFMIQYIWRLNYIITRAWFVALLPFLVLSVVYIIEHSLKSFKTRLMLCGFVILCLLISPSFSHPSFFLMSFIAILLAGVIAYVRNPAILKRASLLVVMTSVILIVVNAYWLVPRYGTLSAEYENAATVGITTVLTSNSQNLNLAGNFLLSSTPPIYDKVPWYSWTDFYSSPLFLVASSVLTILGIYALVRKDKVAIVIASFYFSFLLLAIGTAEPFGLFKEALFVNIAPLQAFRDPAKWGFLAVLLMSLLIGLGYGHWHNEQLRKKKLLFTAPIIIFSVFIVGYPYFAKDIIPTKYSYPDAQISIPDDYYSAAKILRAANNYKPIVQLPLHGTHNYAKWDEGNGYKGVDLMRNLSGQPVLDMNADYSIKNVLKGLQDSIATNSLTYESGSNILAGLGTQYLVINFDRDGDYIKGPSPIDIENRLLEKNIVKTEFRSNNIGIYQNISQIGEPVEVAKAVADIKLLERPNLTALNSGEIWSLTAKDNVATFTESNRVLSLQINADRENQSFYIKNDKPLNLSPFENEYISLGVTDTEDYRFVISAEDVDGTSIWLPNVTKDIGRNSLNDLAYLKNVYSLSDFEKPIAYFRINVIPQKPLSEVLKIDGLSSITGLSSDYRLYSRNDLSASVYASDSSYRSTQGVAKLSNYLRHDPTSKTFSVEGRGEILLLNRQLYDKGWKLMVEKDGKSTDSNAVLIPANANNMMWKINIDALCKAHASMCTESSTVGMNNVNLKLVYAPQQTFTTGAKITIASTLLMLIVVLSYGRFTKINMKHKSYVYRANASRKSDT